MWQAAKKAKEGSKGTQQRKEYQGNKVNLPRRKLMSCVYASITMYDAHFLRSRYVVPNEPSTIVREKFLTATDSISSNHACNSHRKSSTRRKDP
nr:hypothetical protein [Tanacetum cinerariifolium]